MSRSLPLHGALPASLRPSRAKPELALAAKGFRPFFLLAAAFAAAIVPLWLLILSGRLGPVAYLDPLSWHSHEMLFGFTVAVIAGFLLTAVGNWTQRETVVGPLLLGLAGVWLAGRLALVGADSLSPGLVAAVDLAFLPLLAVAIARPLVRTKNRRNLVMVALLLLLFAANGCMHAEALGWLPLGSARRASLASVDLVIVMIAIMAGRVFPMFTRNATGVTTIRSSRLFDGLSIGSLVGLVVLDAAGAGGWFVALWAGLAAVLALLRAVFWGTRRVFAHPLLWILHLGYAWIPVGLLLRAFASTGGWSTSLATHALTLGAIGSITLGMMARVSLGHGGRPLVPPRPMTLAFVAITGAVAARVVLPLLAPGFYLASLYVAGTLWTLAFVIFVAVYTPILLRPRLDGKPG